MLELKEMFEMAKNVEKIVKGDPKWSFYQSDGKFYLTHEDSGHNLIIRNPDHFKEIVEDIDSYLEKIYEEMKNNGQMDESGLLWKKI